MEELEDLDGRAWIGMSLCIVLSRSIICFRLMILHTCTPALAVVTTVGAVLPIAIIVVCRRRCLRVLNLHVHDVLRYTFETVNDVGVVPTQGSGEGKIAMIQKGSTRRDMMRDRVR